MKVTSIYDNVIYKNVISVGGTGTIKGDFYDALCPNHILQFYNLYSLNEVQ